MLNHSFNSALAPYIEGFLEYKHSLGYSYVGQETKLKNLDRFWLEENGNPAVISRETLLGWSTKRETESTCSRGDRLSIVRQLSLYMNGIGVDAYIPTDRCTASHPVIHILSPEEIVEFIGVVDNYNPPESHRRFSRLANEYRVVFRLLLTTGMRRSEAACIKIEDIDLSARNIKIYGTKNYKDRIVFIPPDMADLIAEYIEYLKNVSDDSVYWLFPSFDITKPMPAGTITDHFRQFWRMTSYAGTLEKSPTVHSLRHTYVVMKMNQWMKEGVDLNVMMPYLSKQLGHKSINETFYYYHQVKEAFDIIRQKDTIATRVIPEARIR